ncbi:MAG: hypothetical protein JW963_13420 [Anaerolineales bacterium]|nr:hypothetical protein [Anaerolineales bacterium]
MPFLQSLQRFPKNKKSPIILLLTVNLVIGLLTFQDYGFSLDEPLFYSYADAIGYAYSPAEWFSGEFDLINAYGASAGDHANRGPAYLLIARLPAHLLQSLGLDVASSWHLVNFLAFQVGLYFFYIFCLRWMRPWAAFGATAFMSTQPILWEHAFINPKDPSFLVFFLITLELGFRMAERLAKPQPGETKLQTLKQILLPAILLGLTTNIRVLGPLAAALVGLYFLTLRKPARIWWFIPYGLIAYAVMVITWPDLWEAPFCNFYWTIRFMSDNPTTLQVYFYGDLYPANALPLRYLPAMMLFTLTEPVWPLAGLGFVIAAIRAFRKNIQWQSLLPTLGWFVIPIIYVLLRRPPMYDGFRHFLFILPPLFVLGGIALDAAFDWVRRSWLQAALVLALLLPGIIPGIRLHPYQYTYYNQFVGGTGKAALRFETDYWLTCYKEAVEQLEPFAEEPVNLFVKREFYIASYYAPENINVLDYKRKSVHAGDYVLNHSRANPALQRFKDISPFFLRVERDGAIFCEIQRY